MTSASYLNPERKENPSAVTCMIIQKSNKSILQKEKNQPHAFGTRPGRKTCLAHGDMAADSILADVNIQTRYPIVRLPGNISQLILCLPVRMKIARHHGPRGDNPMLIRQVPLCEGGLHTEWSDYHVCDADQQ